MLRLFRNPKPFMPETAVSLALYLGHYHACGDVASFRTTLDRMVDGYSDAIRRPYDHRMRWFPNVPRLVEYAKEGISRVVEPSEDDAHAIGAALAPRFRELFAEILPRFDGVVSDPSTLVTQRVITALVTRRREAVMRAEKAGPGFFSALAARRNAQAVQAHYMRDPGNDDLAYAYSISAINIADEVLGGVHRGDLAVQLMDDVGELLSATRVLVSDPDLQLERRLSQIADMLEEYNDMRPSLGGSTTPPTPF